jgi:hypothetical protein
MPNLVLENVPQEIYDDLRRAAEANRRSLVEEAMERLKPNSSHGHLPDEGFLTEEIPAPCTLPILGSGKPIMARRSGPHLPGPPWVTTGER